MNILLIDNGTIRLNELKTLIGDNNVEIVKFGELDLISYKKFDLIILSGSSHFPILGNKELYRNEIELIMNSDKPIIGICLGFELIGYAYGAEMCKLNFKESGIVKIRAVNDAELFENIQNFEVYESHRWAIKQAPADFIELARSDDGIEAFKHKNRKVYGFQFHPEMFVEKTCGDEIFYNLLNSIG